jgi:hypothetical protein
VGVLEMADIAETKLLLNERLMISMKDYLSEADRERLAWLNKNILIPPTEHYTYRGFHITFYPLEDQWAGSHEGTCFYRHSQKEVYNLIDRILDEKQSEEDN